MVPKSSDLAPPTVVGTFVLFSGVVAERVKVLLNVPVFTGLPEVSLNFNSINGAGPVGALLTVIADVPVTKGLLTEAAVIVAVPAATAVTNPLAFTVATPVLLLVHVTLEFVAFDGVIAGVS